MKKYIRRAGWILLAIAFLGFMAMVVIGSVHLNGMERTQDAVDRIHATKLQLSDVMGTNLPPDPGDRADATIQGVDANKNGIRDDVELAIFKQYPNSAKTRAVLLQYALVLQTEAVNPLNADIADAVSEEDSKAYSCIGNIVPVSDDDLQKIKNYRTFVEEQQLNTSARKDIKNSFDQDTRSFELQSGCDVDLGPLPN